MVGQPAEQRSCEVAGAAADVEHGLIRTDTELLEAACQLGRSTLSRSSQPSHSSAMPSKNAALGFSVTVQFLSLRDPGSHHGLAYPGHAGNHDHHEDDSGPPGKSETPAMKPRRKVDEQASNRTPSRRRGAGRASSTGTSTSHSFARGQR